MYDCSFAYKITVQYCTTEAGSIHKEDGRARRRQGLSARAAGSEPRGGWEPNGAGERAANGAGTECGARAANGAGARAANGASERRGGRTANSAGARAASTSTEGSERRGGACSEHERGDRERTAWESRQRMALANGAGGKQRTAQGANSERRGGACSEHERGGRGPNGAGERAANGAGTERERRAAKGARARGADSERRRGACNEHERGGRAANGAGEQAGKAYERGCQRSGDAAASRANRGQKLEVLIGARKEAILAKPQSKQEGQWRKGAGVVEDGSKARCGCGAPSIEAGGGANAPGMKNERVDVEGDRVEADGIRSAR
ncbi:hypothetical protein B0H14DRAFT_2627365 [Mycena olivaceomarginata]|nr:hypothetical protein B0H14DRAFT_2627365 [Mycena olivaceomarginata]